MHFSAIWKPARNASGMSCGGGEQLVLSVQETDRHRHPAGSFVGFMRGRMGAKILAIAILLLFSPILSLASSFGLSHLTQPDSSTAPKLAVPANINLDFTLTASPSYAFVGDEITFFANASSDIPGATLTFTIFYDYVNLTEINVYSAVSVNTTSNPGSVVVKHTYNAIGNWTDDGTDYYFYVNLAVYDGADNRSLLEFQLLKVFVNYQRPPEFRTPPANPLKTNWTTNTTIPIYIDDPNGDTVTVLWDFGDGTTRTNVTVAPKPPGGVFLFQSHTWNPKIPGNPPWIFFDLRVTLSDGFNPPVESLTVVNVTLPENAPPTFELQPPPSTVSPLQQIFFAANATDREGDPLTWTYSYSDGTTHVFHTDWSTPGELIWQNDTHAFAAVGNYTLDVSVSDALVPFQTGYHNTSRSALIQAKANVPPVLTIITLNPTSPQINATIGYVDAYCSIDAIDADGDIATLTWSLDGVVVGTNLTGGEKNDFVKYTHVIRFNETGTYNLSVTITDGRPGHESGRFKVFNVTSNNLPPAVMSISHAPFIEGDFASPNEIIRFVLVASDPELDTIELIWEFSDGSPRVYMNLTEYVAGNVTAFMNHTFVKVGDYTITIFLTDNERGVLNHTLIYEIPIHVAVRPPKVVASWDWWDYTSLGLVILIPVGIVLWAVQLRIHRKRIEDQGMTLEEYKLRREIESEELKKL